MLGLPVYPRIPVTTSHPGWGKSPDPSFRPKASDPEPGLSGPGFRKKTYPKKVFEWPMWGDVMTSSQIPDVHPPMSQCGRDICQMNQGTKQKQPGVDPLVDI